MGSAIRIDGIAATARRANVAVRNARLRLQFLARQVNLVVGGRGRLEVSLNGRLQKTIEIRGEPRLYTLLDLPTASESLLELHFAPGVSAYAFTFG